MRVSLSQQNWDSPKPLIYSLEGSSRDNVTRFGSRIFAGEVTFEFDRSAG